MSHVRQQIREAFVSKLAGISGVVTLSANRIREFGQSEMPAINITTPSETIEFLDRSSSETLRSVTVDVTVFASGEVTAPDEVDDISAEIETRILAAVGEPWDSMIEHRPSNASFSVGDVAESTLFALQTRFSCRFSATNAETIG